MYNGSSILVCLRQLVLLLPCLYLCLVPGGLQTQSSRNSWELTWLAVRTKKGRGTGVAAELGHSSSDMSAKLSRKPPPEVTDSVLR